MFYYGVKYNTEFLIWFLLFFDIKVFTREDGDEKSNKGNEKFRGKLCWSLAFIAVGGF